MNKSPNNDVAQKTHKDKLKLTTMCMLTFSSMLLTCNRRSDVVACICVPVMATADVVDTRE